MNNLLKVLSLSIHSWKKGALSANPYCLLNLSKIFSIHISVITASCVCDCTSSNPKIREHMSMKSFLLFISIKITQRNSSNFSLFNFFYFFFLFFFGEYLWNNKIIYWGNACRAEWKRDETYENIYRELFKNLHRHEVRKFMNIERINCWKCFIFWEDFKEWKER